MKIVVVSENLGLTTNSAAWGRHFISWSPMISLIECCHWTLVQTRYSHLLAGKKAGCNCSQEQPTLVAVKGELSLNISLANTWLTGELVSGCVCST